MDAWDVITRDAAEAFPESEWLSKLASGRPLRVKLGLDPTAPHVTLGWAVVLRKLRQFQDLGHIAVLIVGDYTARVGDPSGRDSARPMLSRDEVDAFAENVLRQFRLILRPDRLEIRRNSEWLAPLGTDGLLKLLSRTTLARTLERDDFERRFKEHEPISLMELAYPLLQGYDSVAVASDVEIGGTDQRFNLLAGRDQQRNHGMPAQVILTMPLIEGTDGVDKMSQSKGNYVAVTEPPDDMFGKLMRLPDALMGKYFRLTTDLGDAEADSVIASSPPEEAKRRLASEVVRLYHGDEAAQEARARFDLVHRDHGVPEDVVSMRIPPDCVDDAGVYVPRLLAAGGLASSSSQGRRYIEQGGVYVDGDRLTEETVPAERLHGRVLRRGPRTMVRILP